jgi:hypothetical protein
MNASAFTITRLVAWNCAGGFKRKASVVHELAPDLVVLSEAEEESAESLGQVVSGSVWIGEPGKRGLAVIGLNGWKIEPPNIKVPEQLFLPVRAYNHQVSIQLVAACIKKTSDYVTPTLSALKNLRGFIQQAPTVVAGDFNQSVVFDKGRPSARHFRRVLQYLDRIEFRSAWHTARGEEMGLESEPTLYWRWSDQPQSRFHIDYVFASGEIEIRSVELGTFERYTAQKLSDHVPLSVDLALWPQPPNMP